ncbi:MAG: radical SAM protein [Thermodesulfobacteriota bacterium]
MKLLFLYPEYSYPRKNPPIGLASLAASALEQGHEAEIIDLNVLTQGERRDLPARIKAAAPDLVGVSFMTNQYASALGLIGEVRGALPGASIVAGGPHASALPRDLLREAPGLDLVVYGEGEIPLARLLAALAQDPPPLEGVPNLCYRRADTGEIVQTPPAAEAWDFEKAPWPAWRLLDLDRYEVFGAGGDAGKRTFALLSSRGCPGHCTFCDSHTIFGRRFRGRSADNLFREIIYLHENFGMEQFDFVDDLITLDRDRLEDLCRRLITAPTRFTWMANARVNTVDEDLLRLMKDAGCVRLDLGVESADPEVRRRMKKGITNEQIVRAHQACKKVGLYVGTFLMVGNLGETMDSVKATARLMKGLSDDPNISIACPYPGTELFRLAEEKGLLLTKDWSRYGTAPTFMADYRPVMRTEEMTPGEILKAYYYLVSVFATDKFRSRYGRRYYLNPRFLREYVLLTRRYGGFRRKSRLALTLLANLVRNKVDGLAKGRGAKAAGC